jgi:hypothetical protein
MLYQLGVYRLTVMEVTGTFRVEVNGSTCREAGVPESAGGTHIPNQIVRRHYQQ